MPSEASACAHPMVDLIEWIPVSRPNKIVIHKEISNFNRNRIDMSLGLAILCGWSQIEPTPSIRYYLGVARLLRRVWPHSSPSLNRVPKRLQCRPPIDRNPWPIDDTHTPSIEFGHDSIPGHLRINRSIPLTPLKLSRHPITGQQYHILRAYYDGEQPAPGRRGGAVQEAPSGTAAAPRQDEEEKEEAERGGAGGRGADRGGPAAEPDGRDGGGHQGGT